MCSFVPFGMTMYGIYRYSACCKHLFFQIIKFMNSQKKISTHTYVHRNINIYIK